MSRSPIVALAAGWAAAFATAIGGANVQPALADAAADVCGALAGNTTWTAAGGPYRTTCDVTVPAGTTLTIEAGARVALGAGHRIDVAGRLVAAGSAEAPVRFEPDGAQPWGSVQLRPGSGPSTIAHAVLTGGGALRKEMLGIETDAAIVADSTIVDTAGVGVEIRAGASPTIAGNLFLRASTTTAQPSAALRVFGPSRAEVRGNRFESNQQYPIVLDGAADVRLSGNRLEYNAYNAVLVTGQFTGQTTLASLGPRRYAYHFRAVTTVRGGARLAIEPGATLRFFAGTGLTVEGTLHAVGQPGREIVFTSDADSATPGTWGQIKFADGSVDHDPASGAGSRLEHAVVAWGGFDASGAVLIQRSSPRLAHVTVHHSGHRGVTVEGDGARPALVGLVVRDQIAETHGIGLQVRSGAAPTVRFSTIAGNWLGVDIRGAARPDLGGHNHFSGNATFAVRNDDIDTVCVPARGNDWGAADGPLDGSTRADACQGGDHAGSGQLVTDGVDYAGWIGQLPPPSITRPRCGQIDGARPAVGGDGPPDSTIIVYDDGVEIGRTTTGPAGDDGVAAWSFTPSRDLGAGSHVLQARAERPDGQSAPGAPLGLVIDPDAILAGDLIAMRQDLEGTRYSQPYANGGGCALVSDDSAWQVAMHPGAPLELTVGSRCPGAVLSASYRDTALALTPAGDGRFSGTFEMGDGGPLTVTAACGPRRQTVDLGTVQVALGGFVHDALAGGDRRIRGAKVTLYRHDPAIDNFRVWKAADHGDQVNPQTTGHTGWYGFYPPPGRYRAVVEAAGYSRYIAPELALNGQPYHVTIPLQPLATPTPKPAHRILLPVAARGAIRP